MSKKLSTNVFLKNIHDTIRRYEMLRPGEGVLVAVSGGPDSVCLLDALNSLSRKLGIKLVAANLDHGIRGALSAKDSAYVKKLSRRMGLKSVHKKLKLKHERGSERSLEERAREKRYEFFIREAKKNRCGCLATGHTMDDQAETVLMRFILGSSLTGIAGIPPVREEKGLRIVRPLIRTEKKDIIAYLKARGLDFRRDHTNKEEKYFRNTVRLKVLPYLKKYNPSVKRSIVNFSDSAREELFLTDQVKRKILEETISGLPLKSAEVRTGDIILQNRAVRKHVLKKLFERAGGEVKRLTHRHWMEMDHFVRASAANKSLDLPGSVSVVKTREFVKFVKKGV